MPGLLLQKRGGLGFPGVGGQDGTWEQDPRKTIESYRSQYKEQIVKLADIEKKMGLGGNHIIDITKNKVENIVFYAYDGNDSNNSFGDGNIQIDSTGVFPGEKWL